MQNTNKSKAILEQRNDLLELEKLEMKEQLDNQKSMYESMLKALQKSSDTPNYEKHLKLLKDNQAEQDKERSSIRKDYEKQITELKQKLSLLEWSEKDLKELLKNHKNEYKLQSRQNEVKISELEFELRQAVSEKQKVIEKLRESLDKMEEKYNTDLDKLKGSSDDRSIKLQQEYESKLNDIRFLHEQEELTLKNQIRKLRDELALMKETDSLFDLASDTDQEENRGKTLHIRLSELNDKMSEDMLQNEMHINELNKEKEDAFKQI